MLRAGVSSICITPDRPIWMAGHSDRDRPSEGKYQDLFVKSLALQDERGKHAVIVTADFIGYRTEYSESVLRQAQERFGLQPDEVLLNASHTHDGPALSTDPEYANELVSKTVEAIGRALNTLEPVRLWRGQGRCTLSVNRRRPRPEDPTRMIDALLPNPQGATDDDVPVLKVVRADGSIRAVLCLYACHPTTTEFYLLGGDYVGFAQQFLEEELAGATALFLQGCGGDIKPRNVDGAGRFKYEPQGAQEGFGRELAQAVLTVLAGELSEVDGQITTGRAMQELPVQALPSRGELEARARQEDWPGTKARRVLVALDSGQELPRSHRHTTQVLTIRPRGASGNTSALRLVGLSGEMCIDYVLRLKRELGQDTWVSGYCYDVSAYIPSARMIPQGGYEVEGWLVSSALPTPFQPEIEQRIVDTVHALLNGHELRETPNDASLIGSRSGDACASSPDHA